MKRPFLIYTSLVLLTFVLAGLLLEPVAARDESYRYLSNFSESLDLIEKNYVDRVQLGTLVDGAYRGLLEELDPESYYLDPAELKRARESRDEGGPAGIGIEISKRHGYAVVVSVLPGGPAEGKLRNGDYLRFIDQASTRDLTVLDVRRRLRGAAGSEVKLKVVRRDSLDSEEVALTRRVLPAPQPAIERLEGGAVRVVMRAIDPAAVETVARELRASRDVTGVVLDLREAATGAPADGARLADLFLDSGVLARVHGKTAEGSVKRALAPLEPTRAEPEATGTEPAAGYEYRVAAVPDDTVWRGPLAVLIDEGTAGPAEVAAAALGDADRATLVGRRTFGRASIQDLFPLDDGGALNLTVARFLTPAGDSLLAKGLEPDETVEAVAGAPGDPVLDKALERLKSDGQQKKAA